MVLNNNNTTRRLSALYNIYVAGEGELTHDRSTAVLAGDTNVIKSMLFLDFVTAVGLFRIVFSFLGFPENYDRFLLRRMCRTLSAASFVVFRTASESVWQKVWRTHTCANKSTLKKYSSQYILLLVILVHVRWYRNSLRHHRLLLLRTIHWLHRNYHRLNRRSNRLLGIHWYVCWYCRINCSDWILRLVQRRQLNIVSCTIRGRHLTLTCSVFLNINTGTNTS